MLLIIRSLMDPINPLGFPASGFLATEKATGQTVYERAKAKGYQAKYAESSRKIVILGSSQLEQADLIKILYDNSVGTPYKVAFPSICSTKDAEGNFQIEFTLNRPKIQPSGSPTSAIATVADTIINNKVVEAHQPVTPILPPPPAAYTAAMQLAIGQKDTAQIQSLLFEHAPGVAEFSLLCINVPTIALRAITIYPGLTGYATYNNLEQLSKNPEGEDLLIALLEAKGSTRDSRELLLHNALAHGLVRAAMKLIYAGANIHMQDAAGLTPLHIAVRENRLAFVSLLLERGSNIFIKDSSGKTALDMAIEMQFESVEQEIGKHDISYLLKRDKAPEVRKLLEKKIILTTENMHELWLTYPLIAMEVKGDYPALIQNCPVATLERFAMTDEGIESIIALIHLGLMLTDDDFLVLCQKAPQDMIKVVNAHPVLARGFSVEVMEGLYTMVNTEELIIRLIELEVLSDPSHLHLAISNNMQRAAMALIDCQVGLAYEESTSGWTPLFLAIRGGYTELVDKMIRAGAEVAKQDSMKKTPMHLAAQDGHKGIVELLLNAGADPLAVDEQEKTARDFARCNGQAEIAAFLSEKELERAIAQSLGPKVIELLGEGILLSKECFFTLCQNLPELALDIFDQHVGYVAEFPEQKLFALLKGAHHDALIVKLLQQGVNPNAQETRSYENTLLHHACHHGYIQTVQKLLELQVDSSIPNKGGFTALHTACVAGHRLIVRALLKGGANVWQKNEVNGETALHMVIANGQRGRGCAKTILRALGMPKPFRALVVEHLELSLDLILAKLIEKTLQDPVLTRSCCLEASTPLLAAHILKSKPLAVAIMRKLSHKERLAGMQILIEKHPAHISEILDTCCTIDPAHLALGNLCQMNATPPDTDVEDLGSIAERFLAVTEDAPDQIFKIDGQARKRKDIAKGIRTFTDIIKNKTRITASPPGDSPAFEEQYKIVYNSIANVIKHLEASQNSPAYKSEVLDVSKDLTYASWACFAQYRATATTLYQKYCLGIDPTLENALLQQLQALRGILVESMQAEPYVIQGSSVHAIHYIKRMLGEELELMNKALFAQDDGFERGSFKSGLPSKETLRNSFTMRYTPSTVFSYIRGALTDERMGNLYTAWARKHLKELMPGYEMYKERKRQLEEMQNALLKKMLKSQNTLTQEEISAYNQELNALAEELSVETCWGKTQVESIELNRTDIINEWLQAVETQDDKQIVTLKPFGIFAALVEHKILSFNT